MDQFESQWSLHSVTSLSTEDLNWTLQPNYSKMMNDTNLIDSCAAATKDMEPARRQVPMKQTRKHSQFLESNNFKTQQMSVDPEQLEQWIVYMDRYLRTFSPNSNQIIQMDSIQREISFNEQCKLRQYIASHIRIFNQMMKEEKSKRTRNVHHMYHLLLLNAIEKQIWFEENFKPEEDSRSEYNSESETFDNPNVKLDVYKICNIDIAPQHELTESLFVNSDSGTKVTSDDGIHFATHPTTSKSSLFSEDQSSSFSSDPDYQHVDECHSLQCIHQQLNDNSYVDSSSIELHTMTKNSLISESSLELIRNVDQVLPTTPNGNELLDNKIDIWLSNHHTGGNQEMDLNTYASTTDSDVSSNNSIQWDNFQDIYSLGAPMNDYEETVSKQFLFFGDDYDDALKSKCNSSSTSLSDTHLSTTPEILTCKSNISERERNKNVEETVLSNESETASHNKRNNRGAE